MTAGPPQNKTGRAFARPAACSDTHRWPVVKRGGPRAWLEVAGSLVELGRRDPERAARVFVTWSAWIARASGDDLARGVLARSGGQP